MTGQSPAAIHLQIELNQAKERIAELEKQVLGYQASLAELERQNTEYLRAYEKAVKANVRLREAAGRVVHYLEWKDDDEEYYQEVGLKELYALKAALEEEVDGRRKDRY